MQAHYFFERSDVGHSRPGSETFQPRMRHDGQMVTRPGINLVTFATDTRRSLLRQHLFDVESLLGSLVRVVAPAAPRLICIRRSKHNQLV